MMWESVREHALPSENKKKQKNIHTFTDYSLVNFSEAFRMEELSQKENLAVGKVLQCGPERNLFWTNQNTSMQGTESNI